MGKNFFILFFLVFMVWLWGANAQDSLPSSSSLDAVKKEDRQDARSAIEAGINKKLRTEQCRFVSDDTVSEVRCASGGLEDLISYLSDWQNGLESSIANDVNIYIHAEAKNAALAQSRAASIKGRVRARIGFWDYYVTSSLGRNTLTFKVKIN